MRIHHAQVHDVNLPNRECERCSAAFYDENSTRALCDDCLSDLNQVDPKPDSVELPDDRDWSELTSYQRYYYRNREEEQRRTNRRQQALRQWYRRQKAEFVCSRCGEGHPACLEFHHRDEKRADVAEMVRNSYSKEKIRREMERCVVLCANCHRKEHASEKIHSLHGNS